MCGHFPLTIPIGSCSKPHSLVEWELEQNPPNIQSISQLLAVVPNQVIPNPVSPVLTFRLLILSLDFFLSFIVSFLIVSCICSSRCTATAYCNCVPQLRTASRTSTKGRSLFLFPILCYGLPEKRDAKSFFILNVSLECLLLNLLMKFFQFRKIVTFGRGEV
jgi:hypothetical protein